MKEEGTSATWGERAQQVWAALNKENARAVATEANILIPAFFLRLLIWYMVLGLAYMALTGDTY